MGLQSCLCHILLSRWCPFCKWATQTCSVLFRNQISLLSHTQFSRLDFTNHKVFVVISNKPKLQPSCFTFLNLNSQAWENFSHDPTIPSSWEERTLWGSSGWHIACITLPHLITNRLLKLQNSPICPSALSMLLLCISASCFHPSSTPQSTCRLQRNISLSHPTFRGNIFWRECCTEAWKPFLQLK